MESIAPTEVCESMSAYRGFHPWDHRHTRAAKCPHRPPAYPCAPPTTVPGNSVTRGCFAFARRHVSGTIQRTFPSIGPLSLSAEVLRLTHTVACISGEFLPAAEWFLLHRQTNHTSSNLLFLFAALSPLGLQEKPSFSASSSVFSPL